MEDAPRVCANCRVLVEPAGRQWRHVPEFAEKFSRSVCQMPEPGREASGSEQRFGLARVKMPGGDKRSIKQQIIELDQPAGAPITIAVDGSYKLVTGDRVIKPMSWAYLGTNGLYGLGTTIAPGRIVGGSPRLDGSDPERTLQAELRAIANALAAVGDRHPVHVLSDSQDALGFLSLWDAGHQVMPSGYSLERSGGRESTLGRLARRLHENGDQITWSWVRAHTGHPLNEGADALAKIARAWATGRLERDTVLADARIIALTALQRHADEACPV
jgi:ribonuclease HI